MIIKVILQFVLLAFIIRPAHSYLSTENHLQDNKPGQKKSFGLFDNEDPIETTLIFNITSYLRNKPAEGYLGANIIFHLNEKDSVSRDVRMRTRGIFRKSYCYYPPIELNFKKADFGYSDLDKISKIKMVLPCKAGVANEKYVLREYLVYKMFNVLTDTSFRVRLLKLTCIDSEKKRKTYNQFAFLIEPVDMLTKRTNSMQIKSKALNQKNIVPRIMDRLAIFNYMIGNYDWSVPGQHNLKVIKPLIIDTLHRAIAIPYDFDWTGIVDASYAVPAEIVGVETVRERLFTGVCRTRDVYENELKEFVAHKDEFYRLVNDFEYFDKRDKKDITNYLDQFFDHLTGYNNVVDIFLRTCKKF
jgi:hypothetical protein